MGISKFSMCMTDKYLKEGSSICELGNQTLFYGDHFDNPAKPFFEKQGYKHTSIDLNGEDGALPLDLQDDLDIGQFDIVTDFGTSEHVLDIYSCWKNKYNMCKVDGVIISSNPEVGSWSLHKSYHFFTQAFYTKLVKQTPLSILEIGRNASGQNTKNGWLVYCVLKKLSNAPFISRDAFNNLGLVYSSYKERGCNE